MSGSLSMAGAAEEIVRAYSRRFHNIYLFVTERCQLRCGHCYMGDRLDRGLTMPHASATKLIQYFHRLGADYITFVGGEPTLHPKITDLIAESRRVGYRKVMIDTNGFYIEPLLSVPPCDLYYVRVSLDGTSPTTHDRVRGAGAFRKTLEGLRALVDAGHTVRITYTLFTFNLHELDDLAALAEEFRVKTINLHTFSREGYGRGNPAWAIQPEACSGVCESIRSLGRRFDGTIRYPPTWVRREEVEYYAKRGYKGCLGCSLDRLSVFPDGRCYVCSMLFDTGLNFGYITEEGLCLNRGVNEYELFVGATVAADTPALTGCPAEHHLNLAPGDDVVSICRLWRTDACA